MAKYSAIKAAVNAYIKQNGKKEITGRILNSVLNATIDSLGRFFQFAGGAMPTDDPGTPDQNVCYLAGEPGVYTYFGGITIENEEVALLFWDGEWTKQRILIGIQEVNASVDNQVGTPSVDVSYSGGQLVLTFHNLKGEQGIQGIQGIQGEQGVQGIQGVKGDTGAAAGFGTIGADITGGVGTPGVSVETSGDNTAKNLMFHFTNLKGETGVTSVVALVDDTSGTPSCQVSLVNGVLTLAFSGLKGLKGDTGVSADYPITIYNGLDSDATDQALAAAQGKVLDGKISQLGQKTSEKWALPERKIEGFYIGYISTNSNFTNVVQSSATIRSRTYDVTSGQKYKIYGTASSNNYYRIYAIFAADGTRIERDTTNGDYTVNPKEVTIPSNGAHMTVNLSDYNAVTDGVYLVESTDASTLQKEIAAMDEKLIEKTAMEALVTNGWVLTGNNNGNSATGASGRIKSFQVTAGELLYLKLSADFSGVLQWQSEFDVPAYGTNRNLIGHSINWAVDGYFEVPTGATWLKVAELKTNTTNEVKRVSVASFNDYVRKSSIGSVLWSSIIDRNKHKESALVSVVARGGTEAIKVPNKLSLLHCSDIHGNIANLANIVKFRDYYVQYFDDVIHTGDSVEFYIHNPNPFEIVEGADNILNVVGNHEAWVNTSDTDYYATEKQTYDKIFATSIANWGVVQPTGAAENGYCYYYKDFTTAGFRLIVLDSVHWHYRNGTTDSNPAQKAWFESVLADAITQNLRVVCATHYTPQNGIVPVENTGFNVLGTTAGANIADGWYAADEIFGCVDTFIGNGGKFMGWITGHTHNDYFGTVRNHTGQPIVVMGTSKGSGSGQNMFIANTVSQDNFNVITFENFNEKNYIKIVKIGQDTDIYTRSKSTICYNFTDGVLVSTT